MARNKLFDVVATRQKHVFLVVLRSTQQRVAVLKTNQGNDGMYRYTLDNYPHNHSSMMTLAAALAAIEREVL